MIISCYNGGQAATDLKKEWNPFDHGIARHSSNCCLPAWCPVEKKQNQFTGDSRMSILLPAASSYLFNKLKIEAFLLAIAVTGPGSGTGEGHSPPWDDRGATCY